MPDTTGEALRKALDEMDSMRRRSLTITRVLLCLSTGFLCFSFFVLVIRGNVALGIFCSLTTLYALVSASAINVGGAALANTQKILRAVEDLARERRE